ncbi:MOSC domain-containing protein [Klebsiella sp. F-Nf9]|uniref:MOSC domain-containing protein n=1 Tax=Klebsiella sp. F-Nf9 TaxID=2054602 RepID=UPI003204DA43
MLWKQEVTIEQVIKGHSLVSWGRVACQTMAERLQDPNAPEIMHQQSRNGWFYRVVTPGETCSDDRFILIDRLADGWPLSGVQRIVFNNLGSDEELLVLLAMPFLAIPWRELSMQRLNNDA